MPFLQSNVYGGPPGKPGLAEYDSRLQWTKFLRRTGTRTNEKFRFSIELVLRIYLI